MLRKLSILMSPKSEDADALRVDLRVNVFANTSKHLLLIKEHQLFLLHHFLASEYLPQAFTCFKANLPVLVIKVSIHQPPENVCSMGERKGVKQLGHCQGG